LMAKVTMMTMGHEDERSRTSSADLDPCTPGRGCGDRPCCG
jgi:hypothetical protein